MTTTTTVPQRSPPVVRDVALIAAASAFAALACALLLPRFAPRFGSGVTLAAAVAVVLALALFSRFAVRVRVRGERIAFSLQECVLVVALALVTPALAPLLAAAGAALGQLASQRRSFLKSTFNVAQETLATSVAAALAMGLMHFGAPWLVALLVAPLAYAAVSHLSVAAIVARVESLSVRAVLAQRVGGIAALTLLAGEATGVVVALVA